MGALSCYTILCGGKFCLLTLNGVSLVFPEEQDGCVLREAAGRPVNPRLRAECKEMNRWGQVARDDPLRDGNSVVKYDKIMERDRGTGAGGRMGTPQLGSLNSNLPAFLAVRIGITAM